MAWSHDVQIAISRWHWSKSNVPPDRSVANYSDLKKGVFRLFLVGGFNPSETY